MKKPYDSYVGAGEADEREERIRQEREGLESAHEIFKRDCLKAGLAFFAGVALTWGAVALNSKYHFIEKIRAGIGTTNSNPSPSYLKHQLIFR